MAQQTCQDGHPTTARTTLVKEAAQNPVLTGRFTIKVGEFVNSTTLSHALQNLVLMQDCREETSC